LLLVAVPSFAQERTVERYVGAGPGPGYADGLGTAADFEAPAGIVSDASGNAYVTDRDLHTVRKIAPDGRVSTVAGMAGEAGSADGRGAAARFNQPGHIALERNGNLYVMEGGRVRKISPQGVVTTLASGLGGDGIAVDVLGNVFVSLYDHTIGRSHPPARSRCWRGSLRRPVSSTEPGPRLDSMTPAAWRSTPPAISSLPIPATT
jgi:DNA-binding beta-propeller fold protein YncE